MALASLVKWLEQHSYRDSLGDHGAFGGSPKSKAPVDHITEKYISIARSVVNDSSDTDFSLATSATVDLEIADDDPNPEFADSTPREVLEALIRNYDYYTKKELEAERFDRAESYQRRLIECAVEYKQMFGSREGDLFDISKLRKTLAQILIKKGDKGSVHEGRWILRLVISGSPQLVLRPYRELQVNATREVLDERSRCYQLLSSTYSDDAYNLGIAERYAKRSFRLRLWLKENDSGFPSDDSALLSDAVKELVKGTYRFAR